MMTSATLQTRPLLLELLTEELPPKALQKLGKAFAEGVRATLATQHLLAADCVAVDFATPRRLAVHLSAVREHAPEQSYTEKLMPAKVGLAADGGATPALLKKLASKNLSHLTPADLIHESDGKQDYLYAKGTNAGAALQAGLQAALDYSIGHLPIPKVMRYQLADGVTSVKFVRPAHKLTALWGSTIIDVQTLGLRAGRRTLGHRFMATHAIDVESADSYEQQLLDQGRVIVRFDVRRQRIHERLQAQAHALKATLGTDPEVESLLDEVTGLVEYPAVYAGEFEPEFLQVPPECLILTMRLNQKYFPLFELDNGRLTHRFLIVSNMQVDDPSNIIRGNQRVVRPRLADAQFFFNTDLKTPLAKRIESLTDRVYHNKLGSQRERVERIRRIAVHVARQLNANEQSADRAALLAKADLSSSMVAEFPELQGIMGAYYAAADGEPADVVLALREQYQTRLDAAIDSSNLTSAILFISERVETLIGIWGIGLAPTGERDPYGLRRAALGLINAYERLRDGGYLNNTHQSRLSLTELLSFAEDVFDPHPLGASTVEEVQSFIYERYRNQLANGFDRRVIDAVLCLQPPLHQVETRVRACADFAHLPEAESLAIANKRIANLLKKAPDTLQHVNRDTLAEPAEQELAHVLETLKPRAQAQFAQGDFTASLATMAQARKAVDGFFNDVMVMTDDPAIRANRLALLADLHAIMNQVADISRLAQ